jgi:hypothetical protein
MAPRKKKVYKTGCERAIKGRSVVGQAREGYLWQPLDWTPSSNTCAGL